MQRSQTLFGGLLRVPGVVCGAIMLALVVGQRELVAQGIGIPIGSQPPPAEVQDLEANPIQFLDLIEEGKPTLIEFWATWCEVCAAIQPELDAIQLKHGEEITIIAVAVGVAQTLRRVNRFLEDHNPGYRYVWDADGAAVRSFQAPVTASIILLDGTGTVVYSGVGEGQELMPRVESLLQRVPSRRR